MGAPPPHATCPARPCIFCPAQAGRISRARQARCTRVLINRSGGVITRAAWPRHERPSPPAPLAQHLSGERSRSAEDGAAECAALLPAGRRPLCGVGAAGSERKVGGERPASRRRRLTWRRHRSRSIGAPAPQPPPSRVATCALVCRRWQQLCIGPELLAHFHVRLASGTASAVPLLPRLRSLAAWLVVSGGIHVRRCAACCPGCWQGLECNQG